MKINLSQYDLRIVSTGESSGVFDRLRRKYVALTPEEGVRQRFVEYLIDKLGFPAGLMNNEIAITQNGIKRRCDTVVFDKSANPIMIVEYKAPHVAISQAVFNQIYRYNLVLHVKYLVVTNGDDMYCCFNDYDSMKCMFLPDIPAYDQL